MLWLKRIQNLRLSVALFAARKGYLRTTGWYRSLLTRQSVDEAGEPIPWITYACLRFIEPRIKPGFTVFEFGSGASTLWWSKRVASLISCEHDLMWYEQIKVGLPSNVELNYVSRDGDEYAKWITRFSAQFDIVVIDGRDRVKCAINAVAALKDDGIILWDNSDRQEYAEGYDFLAQHGFRRVDFISMTPINLFECSTAIFYRSANCLVL